MLMLRPVYHRQSTTAKAKMPKKNQCLELLNYQYLFFFLSLPSYHTEYLWVLDSWSHKMSNLSNLGFGTLWWVFFFKRNKFLTFHKQKYWSVNWENDLQINWKWKELQPLVSQVDCGLQVRHSAVTVQRILRICVLWTCIRAFNVYILPALKTVVDKSQVKN